MLNLDGVGVVLRQSHCLDRLSPEAEVLLHDETACVQVPQAEEHATMHRTHWVRNVARVLRVLALI